MKLSSVDQKAECQFNSRYDLVIVASGYESRSIRVAQLLEDEAVIISSKLVIGFEEHTDSCSRRDNDEALGRLGYRAISCSGKSESKSKKIFDSYLVDAVNGQEGHILIDISSMTRTWYGMAIRALMDLVHHKRVSVHFVYSPTVYAPPPDSYPPNQVVDPVGGFTGNALPDKPTALILGLGYDRDRAIGIKDYLDPQQTLLFLSDPAADPKYVDDVTQANAEVISESGKERVYEYDFYNCFMTFNKLLSVCTGVSRDWRVVLCSLGPKTFGLCAFLVAAVLRDVSIWRVSADSREVPRDRAPSDAPPIVLETIWNPLE